MRRVHVTKLTTGRFDLPPSEAHHVRDVLRLPVGTELELFDDSGSVAVASIQAAGPAGVYVLIDSVRESSNAQIQVTVAAAVPKGDRADWMVEKLSELGVARFIPLATARSVVLPTGQGKHQRWERIAVEAAKQSRRIGVMKVESLTPISRALAECLTNKHSGWFLSTEPAALPVATIDLSAQTSLTLFIGPEGGWSAEELATFRAAGLTGVGLTQSILRIETAAVLAAGVVICRVGRV